MNKFNGKQRANATQKVAGNILLPSYCLNSAAAGFDLEVTPLDLSVSICPRVSASRGLSA